MSELHRPAVLLLTLVLVGCATSDHLYLVRRDVWCSLDEPIPFLPEPPERPHLEVARLEASGAVFVPTTWETLRFYLCREALAVEADAVMGLEQVQISYSIGFTPLKIDWTNKKLTALAIRYLEVGQDPDEVEAPPLVDGEGEVPAAKPDAADPAGP